MQGASSQPNSFRYHHKKTIVIALITIGVTALAIFLAIRFFTGQYNTTSYAGDFNQSSSDELSPWEKERDELLAQAYNLVGQNTPESRQQALALYQDKIATTTDSSQLFDLRVNYSYILLAIDNPRDALSLLQTISTENLKDSQLNTLYGALRLAHEVLGDEKQVSLYQDKQNSLYQKEQNESKNHD